MAQPPKLFLKFFRWYCHPNLVKPVEGDLMELYDERVRELGKKHADWKFIKDVILLFRKDIIKPTEGAHRLNTYGMLKNHIKISIRNLVKHRGFTGINIFGLTISMAITMLIILFIMDQDSSDEHNPYAEDIQRVVTVVHDESESKDRTFATSPYAFNQIIPLNVEGVLETAQLVKSSGSLKLLEDEFNYSGLFVSPNFLSFFYFDLIEGNKINALQNQNDIVLSREMSTKLFGTVSPIGQLVTIEESTYTIKGVIDHDAYKSHLTFDVLLPISSFSKREVNKDLLSDWESGAKTFYNYFKLRKGLTGEILNTYLGSMDVNIPNERKGLYRFDTQRLDQINLGSVISNEVGITTPKFVAYFFGVMGLVLILSASFNYMNLAIAKGLKRAKEVGVRKVLGAGKRQVVTQFLVEAQLVIFISLIAAFLLLQMMVPFFNNMKILRDINGAITMDFNANFMVYVVFILFAITVGIVSGVYPAFYLSSFKSLSVLKGSENSSRSRSFLFRKVLVFFQYSFSVIFIITTIVLYQQARNFLNNNYGFDHSNIINVPIKKSVAYEPFRTELLKKSEIANVSAVSNVPVLSFFEEVELMDRSNQKANVKSSIFSVDPFVISNFGLELIAGRNFTKTLQDDDKNTLIINEKALSSLGYSNPQDALNKTIELNATDKGKNQLANERAKIIGVVKNFDFQFVFKESGPLLMKYDPSTLTTMNIKIQGVSERRGAEIIESVWKEFDTNYPMEYETYAFGMADINDEFVELVNMVGLVSFLAIIIACLGQFSMVIHHVQLKVKEIGIRKVLGSSMNSLMFGLSKGFLIVILASIMLSTPLAILINIAWTSRVYNAPEVSFFNILIGLILVVTLAVGTIYFFVRRAVNANPVESLKYE